MRAGYPGHYGQAGDWFSFDYALTSDDTGYKGGKLSYQPQVGIGTTRGAGIFGASGWFDMYDVGPRGNGLGRRCTREITPPTRPTPSRP